MPLDLYLAFLAATAILMLIPGPNVALIVANSVSRGIGCGLLTVAGTSSAMVLQISFTLLGMTALLSFLAEWFEWLRWMGVAYLLWLGLRAWRAPPVDLTKVAADRRPALRIYLRGFLVSLTNPKTLLFYGAFLPQFVSADGDVEGQLLLLSGSFLAVAVLFDSTWAVLAGWMRGLLAANGRIRNRLTGGLLVGAGVGLAAARSP